MRVLRMWHLGPKRALAALAVLTMSAAVVVGSGANFTAHSANPGNMITEGTFAISNTKDGQAIFAPITGFDPGDSAEGTVSIGNSGNEPGTFTLSGTAASTYNAAFAANIHLNVVEFPDDTFTGNSMSDGYRYDGTLADFLSGGPYNLDQWANGEVHHYKFILRNDAPQDDLTSQGKSAGFTVAWDGSTT